MSSNRSIGVVREYAESIIIAVIIALIIRAFIVQAFKIPSGSMEPTLLIGDHLLVNKFSYGFHIPFTEKKLLVRNEPERGDIIVFTYPVDNKKDFIKRVIGLPGETVEILQKKIYIDGKLLDDPYGTFRDPLTVSQVPRDNFGPVVVPANNVFVMGDNRDRSYDSRFWGFVDYGKIKGKAMIIYWSWDKQAKKIWYKVRVSRLAQLIR
ncbi:MAG: signal peptidase I [Deltaproteobacteria bacterium]|nr:signal peptidase I [Candidatus Anaeroferrophillus wilburensis]MBN2889886.1 signal peptidase I [Deltaproteobacteria bacterium]